jgi:hypothetical protein
MNRSKFVKACHKILVASAQDLAVLTQKGIRADEIVALAHKCEDLESLIQGPETSTIGFQSRKKRHIPSLMQELKRGISRICMIALNSRETSVRRSAYQRFLADMEGAK